MSRSLYDVAISALDDLYDVQIAFAQFEIFLTVFASKFPEGSDCKELANFAIGMNKDWSDKVSQWADCMDDELCNFPAENTAHFEKRRRLHTKRAGGAV